MASKLKAVYFGTPDFAVPPLAALLQDGRVEIAAVVTAPDKKVGRKQILTPSAVKAFAEKKGVKVLEYASVRKGGAGDLKALCADLFVTCAFGQILSEEILAVTRLYTLNIHGSLLPKYRGAAPIQGAILAGEKRTGITVMQTIYETDAGDMLLQRSVDIGENETAGELSDRLSLLGAACIEEAIGLILSGKAVFTPQDPAAATYVKKIEKKDALLDFSLSAEAVKNRVRAYEPWPCAHTFVGGEQLKIHKVSLACGKGRAGEVLQADKVAEIACGEGSVLLEEVTPQGSRRMRAAEYLCGKKLKKGEILGGC